MKQPQHQFTEALSFQLEPAVDLGGWNVIDIHRAIQGGKGIGALCPDGSGQFVVFIGSDVLGGLVREGVYFLINGRPLLLYFGGAVFLVQI